MTDDEFCLDIHQLLTTKCNYCLLTALASVYCTVDSSWMREQSAENIIAVVGWEGTKTGSCTVNYNRQCEGGHTVQYSDEEIITIQYHRYLHTTVA
jgi:hypothetical protein